MKHFVRTLIFILTFSFAVLMVRQADNLTAPSVSHTLNVECRSNETTLNSLAVGEALGQINKNSKFYILRGKPMRYTVKEYFVGYV